MDWYRLLWYFCRWIGFNRFYNLLLVKYSHSRQTSNFVFGCVQDRSDMVLFTDSCSSFSQLSHWSQRSSAFTPPPTSLTQVNIFWSQYAGQLCCHNLQVNFLVTICRLIFDHNLQANFLVTIYRPTFVGTICEPIFFGHTLKAIFFWSQSAGQFWILVLTCMQLRNPQATAATLTLTSSMNTRTSDQKSCRIDRADDETIHLQSRRLPVIWHFGLASSDEKGGAACYCEVAFPARLRFSICGQVAFCASSPDSLPSYQSCKNYLLNTSQISSWLERIKQKASLI